jgi:hypothetical protein
MKETIQINLCAEQTAALIQSLQLTTAKYDLNNGTKEAYFIYVEQQKLLEMLQDMYKVKFTDWVIG